MKSKLERWEARQQKEIQGWDRCQRPLCGKSRWMHTWANRSDCNACPEFMEKEN